ncbi:unnamed protein product [Toxocara canis]|uniref:Transmembrane protein n=1 Tax=Toxocara canis TaxID=6265 RepID=A0A3P7F4I8_TOXCA|nr:unnamed protein product [Toxocara canis]
MAFVSNGSAPTGDSGRSYLCGLVRLTSACFIVLTLELLILLQTTVFTLINYLHGMEKYNEYNTELGKVIHFPYLLPLLIFQVIWLMSIVASFVSVPTMLPYLMLPHIFLSIVSLLTAIALVALTVYYTFKATPIDAVDAFDTYSRRSTVVINDDYLYIPT